MLRKFSGVASTIYRAQVMERMRVSGAISLSALAASLDIAPSTLLKILVELLSSGVVIERREGRRRLFEFNARGSLVIGVDLGGTKCYGAVANMEGQILREKTLVHHASHRQESYAMLEGFIEALLAETSSLAGVVRGIGVGVPGVVAAASGLVQVCPALDWDDFPLQERLNLRFNPNGNGLPVLVENDVNLAALGESYFGLDQPASSLVLVAIGTGVGAGIIIDGAVYAGARGIAGEIGYLLPDRASLDQLYPGFGALEQRISGPGIAARARAVLMERGQHTGLEAVTAETVFAAARQGEDWAAAVLAETIDGLAQAVAAAALALDPEVIILSGGVMQESGVLLGPILSRLEGRIPHAPRLQVSRLGYRAGVLGAVVKIFRRLAGPYRLMKVF